jgi:formyl-CoA transferase
MELQALSDLKVLELGQLIAGPYCGKLLADFGAEVVKVEAPGVGDEARRREPFLHDEAHPEKSGLSSTSIPTS